MTTVLVVGGTGFLGAELCAQALANGWRVHATYLTTPPPTESEITWHLCDIVDSNGIHALASAIAPDVIINTAYRQTGDQAEFVCAEGADHVAHASKEVEARLVHLSTDLVFDGDLGRPYLETDAVSPLGAYGSSKVRGETLVLAALPTALIARTSLIYGRPDAPQERLVLGALAPRSSIAFFTDEWRNPVHVSDLAESLLTLSDSDVCGVLHLAGQDRVDRLTFAQNLARRLGHDPQALVGQPQDPALGRRGKDVSLDMSRSVALGQRLPGIAERLIQDL